MHLPRNPPNKIHTLDILPRCNRGCRVIRSQDIKSGAVRLSASGDARVGHVRQIGKDLVRKRRAVGASRAGQPAAVAQREQAKVITRDDSEVAYVGAVPKVE